MGEIPWSLLRLGTPSLTSISKSQKWSNMTSISFKPGQGPTGPQNSPMTHPDSLWYGKRCFKILKLSSICLELLLRQSLLLNELLNYLLGDKPFQTMFYCCDHMFQLCTFSLNLFEKCVGFVLHRLVSLCHFHNSSLDGSDLLLNFALLLWPFHLLNNYKKLQLCLHNLCMLLRLLELCLQSP